MFRSIESDYYVAIEETQADASLWIGIRSNNIEFKRSPVRIYLIRVLFTWIISKCPFRNTNTRLSRKVIFEIHLNQRQISYGEPICFYHNLN